VKKRDVTDEPDEPDEPDEAPNGLVLGARCYGADELFEPLEAIDWISEPLQWCPGRPAMITAFSGSLKSIATLSAGIALAAGLPIWGEFRTVRRRVLYLCPDSGKRAAFSRFQRLARGMGIGPEELRGQFSLIPHPRIKLTHEDARKHYSAAIRGYNVAFLDAQRGFLPGVDENDSRIRDYLDPLAEISDAERCCIVINHHEGKGGATVAGKGGRSAKPDDEAGRGSTGIFESAGSVFRMMREVHDGETLFLVRMAKEAEERSGPRPAPFYLAAEDVEIGGNPRGGLRVVHRCEEQVKGTPKSPGAALEEELARVLAYVREEHAAGRGATADGVAEILKIGRTRAPGLLRMLESRNKIVNRGKAKNRPDWRPVE